MDGVDVLQLSSSTTLLRSVCSQRLKYEVDYGLKRGTTNNCYIVEVNPPLLLAQLQCAWHSPKQGYVAVPKFIPGL